MQPLAAWMAIRSLTEHGSGKRRDLCDGLPFGDLGAEQLVSRDFFPGAPGKKSVITVAQNFQISTILFLHSLWSLILWAPGRGGNSGNAIITSYKVQRRKGKRRKMNAFREQNLSSLSFCALALKCFFLSLKCECLRFIMY